MTSMTLPVRLLTCVLLFVSAATAAAQDPPAAVMDYEAARRDRRLPATQAQGPITLDGRLDEPAWATAPLANGFVQNDPREGEPATFDTEVRLLYDDRALYIGVFAKDPEPAKIIVNELRKDFNTGTADGFQVVIDTFHDERNGYQFAINPMGAKWDAQMSNEGRDNNANWDGIWDVGTRIAGDGWYAEIEIPFKTLKFGPEAMQTWGINFQRRLRRENENSYWSPLRRTHSLSRVSMAGTVDGLEGLRPGANVRVKPYVLGNFNKIAGLAVDDDYDAGFDVKYGVTSGLTWDFTVNTDFSQVEADEQQVNLTRFNLFFPEKRDFFLENSGIFAFGSNVTGGTGGGANPNAAGDMRLFFSRRIGLSDAGEAIPILAGTRLTGRQGAYSVGVLNIQQQEQGAVPGTNFTALRMRRDIFANSDVGAIVLNKEEFGPHYNRLAGVDANFRFGFLNVDGFAAKTFSPAAAVSGRAGNEVAARAAYRYSSPGWQLESSFNAIGDRFNDEMGFVRRQGVNYVDGNYGPRLRFARFSKWLRQTRPHWEVDLFTRQSDGSLDSRYQGFHWNLNFQDGSNFEFGRNTSVEDLRAPFTINNARGINVQPGRYEFGEYFYFYNMSSARRVAVNTRASTGTFYDGTRRSYTVGPSVRLNENLNASVNLQINDVNLDVGDFVTKLVTARVNYNFNTKMFFNALVQYNTDNAQWTSNLRFNIIHRPLSDIFLVYNERRDDRTGQMLSRALIAKMTYLVAF
jgi:hypothetical protein